MNLKQPVHTTMKNVSQGTSWLFLLLCLLFTHCSKTPDSPVTPKSSAKTLTGPTIDGLSGASSSFDAATSTYTVTVPSGTDVTALKIGFTLPTGATAKPASGSVQNFTNPVTYTVTAEDGSTQTYMVKVVVTAAPKSSDKQITAFAFATLSPVVSATIDQTNRKIGATVPSDVNVTALVPAITLSAKATVAPATSVAQDFTNPVSYTVTAEDGSKQIYNVTVSKAPILNSTKCNLNQIMYKDGSRDAFTQDSQGRILRIKYASNDEGVFSYGTAGELASYVERFVDSQGTEQYSYTYSFSYVSARLSQYAIKVSRRGSPDAEVVYKTIYDGNGLLTEIQKISGATNASSGGTFAYDNSGNLTTIKDGSSVFELSDYDTQKTAYSSSILAISHSFIFAKWYGYDAFNKNNARKIKEYTVNSSGVKTLKYETTLTYTYNKDSFPLVQTFTKRTAQGTLDNSGTLNYTYSNCQ